MLVTEVDEEEVEKKPRQQQNSQFHGENYENGYFRRGVRSKRKTTQFSRFLF